MVWLPQVCDSRQQDVFENKQYLFVVGDQHQLIHKSHQKLAWLWCAEASQLVHCTFDGVNVSFTIVTVHGWWIVEFPSVIKSRQLRLAW